MKGINKVMNSIVEEEKKDILATHIEDGYKVIYPNKDVKIKLLRHYRKSNLHNYKVSNIIKSGLICKSLNLYDRLINYRGDLFLTPCVFDNGGYSELIISRNTIKMSFKLDSDVYIYSGTTYLGSEAKFCEKIKYILISRNNDKLRIVVDEKFKTKDAKKYEKIENEKKKFKKELGL